VFPFNARVHGAWCVVHREIVRYAERPLKEIDREEHTKKNVLCRSKKSAPGGATVLWGSIGNEEYEIVGVFSVHVGTTTLVSWCCERDAKARFTRHTEAHILDGLNRGETSALRELCVWLSSPAREASFVLRTDD